MRRLTRWTVATGAAMIAFGASLWLFRFATFSWLPRATADRWVVAASFAAVGAGVVGAGAGWWAGRETETGREQPEPVNNLPRGPEMLHGRREKVGELLALLDPADPQTPTVTAVAGLAGVGKTALILHVAHAAVERGWFPGGALFIDLRGYEPEG